MAVASEAAYRTWLATVKANGGVATSMPAQSGGLAGKPGARYSADTIAAKRLGTPDLWTSGQKFGYFVAPRPVWDAEAAADDNNAWGPDGPSLADRLLGGLSPDNPLFSLGDRLRSLGTIAFWLVIAVAVVIAVFLILRVHRALEVKAA